MRKSKLRYEKIQIARWNKKLPKLKNPNCEMEWKISKLKDGTNIDNAMCVERSLRAKSH